MSPRAPSEPPVLNGFEHVRHLGGGGFADVFEYRQRHPGRRVAIKVILPEVFRVVGLQRFRDEADLMGRLSSHPSIIQVFQSDVAPDGRPYIVMELCRRADLDQRRHHRALDVAEALHIGVQLTSAVHWAHQAGVLHLDIKPANVLINLVGRPVLTDFGISVMTQHAHDAEGVSLPWSAPERLGGTARADEQCDVYSLAATVYTVLAGRTPHERPGLPTRKDDLLHRAMNEAVVPTGNPDVPRELEQVLARSLARDPHQRHAGAEVLGRAFQDVQRALGLPVTALEVVDPDLDDGDEVDGRDRDRGPGRPEGEERTVLRPLVVVDPRGPSGPGRGSEATAHPDLGSTVLRPRTGTRPSSGPVPARPTADPALALTMHREKATTAAPTDADDGAPGSSGTRSRRVVVGGVVLGLLVGGVALALARGAEQEAPAAREDVEGALPDDVVPDVVPAPTELSATATATEVTFTWTNPDPTAGDRYLWREVGPGGSADTELVPTVEARAVVPAAGRQICIEVLLVRANGRSSDSPVTGCGP